MQAQNDLLINAPLNAQLNSPSKLQVRAGWPIRIRHCIINCLAFALCYPLTNWLAQQHNVTRHLAFELDAAMPFLPWMIIPYMSSMVFFIMSFAWVRTDTDVRVLSHRTLLTTVVASLLFAIYPLQFSVVRPAIDAPVFAALFKILSIMDQPYNQLPSLHVAYCLIAWLALRPVVKYSVARLGLAIWLTLVAMATVFTYQHHVVDVVGGLIVGGLAVWAMPSDGQRSQIAVFYAAFAGLVLLFGVFGLRSRLHSLLPLYLAMSLMLVALAYLRQDRHFLGKKNGRYPLWIWLLYAPYLFGYRLCWYGVRWRERHHAPLTRLTPQLWIGRRLTTAEAAQLPHDCVVIDLANELSEVVCLRSRHYVHFSLLDLHPPRADVIEEISSAIHLHVAQGRTVYLHCAMGYSRSKFIAAHYLEKFSA